MKRAEKDALVKKYMVGIPELTDEQREWIRKETAHYIFVSRDESGKHKCVCSSCNSEIDLGKTKHNDKAVCPVCGKEMEIIHTWRRKYYPETIDWIAIPKTIDGNHIMLRYVVAWRYHNAGMPYTEVVRECARMVYRPDTETQHTFEEHYGKWIYATRSYFSEWNMYQFRKWCCRVANAYAPEWETELKKLNCLKDFEFISNFTKSTLYTNTMIGVLGDRKVLYEKLCKAGLKELAQEDFYRLGTYERESLCFRDVQTETKLVRILGINKGELRLLRDNQTLKALKCIKIIPNIDQETLDLLEEAKISLDDTLAIVKQNLKIKKTLRYFIKTKCNIGEWLHYVDLLRKLAYQLDDSYLYPSNFRKEDERVAREYAERLEMFKKEGDKLRNEMMGKISMALHKNKEIRKFFEGSDGLQICVPETAEELREEGKRLHNCLRTYVDKVARGETLIFFVRRIEDPTSAFVALEYRNGRIIQCRFDYNRSVNDKKIIDFTQALAKVLVKNKILAA